MPTGHEDNIQYQTNVTGSLSSSGYFYCWENGPWYIIA
jgi:hypothetical protein